MWCCHIQLDPLVILFLLSSRVLGKKFDREDRKRATVECKKHSDVSPTRGSRRIRLLLHAGFAGRAYTIPVNDCNPPPRAFSPLVKTDITLSSRGSQTRVAIGDSTAKGKILAVRMPGFRNSQDDHQFVLNSSLHHHYTRRMNDIHTRYCRTTKRQNTFAFQGPKLWRQLPSYLTVVKSLSIFKKSVKFYLVNNLTWTI